MRQRMVSEGIGADEAARRTSAQIVFTTHTPVPAGHDRFSSALIEEHLGPLRDELGISHDQLMGLGRVEPQNEDEAFCMTVLALKMSRRANAVSSLHGQVSRAMWAQLWPERSEEEIPIGHITNGVHVPTWLAPQMRQLYDRHLGPTGRSMGEPGFWEAIEHVDAANCGRRTRRSRSRLIDFARRRAAQSAERAASRGADRRGCDDRSSLDALTIGFARRFATYKRADLILHDIELLPRSSSDPQTPVQFVFAGKAHPADDRARRLCSGSPT